MTTTQHDNGLVLDSDTWGTVRGNHIVETQYSELQRIQWEQQMALLEAQVQQQQLEAYGQYYRNRSTYDLPEGF